MSENKPLRYRNALYPAGPEFYEAVADPIECGPYLLIRRGRGLWDVVRYDTCLETHPDRTGAEAAARHRSSQTKRRPLDERIARAAQIYHERTDLRPLDRLPEEEIDILLLYHSVDGTDRTVGEEINRDFAERHGFTQQVSWSGKDLSIKLASEEEAQALKPKLRALGYDYLQTYWGQMREEGQHHWVLQGTKTQGAFADPEGRSAKAAELLEQLGLRPMYSYAHGGIWRAEFELTVENLARLEAFMETAETMAPDMSPFLMRNAVRAVDVVVLSLADHDEVRTNGPVVTTDELLREMSERRGHHRATAPTP